MRAVFGIGVIVVFTALLFYAARDRSAHAPPRTGSAPPRTGLLALKQVEKRLYLDDGSAQLLLEGNEEAAVTRPGGWKLTLNPESRDGGGTARVFRSGRLIGSIPLERLRDEWLKRDDFWGGRSEANVMRYMHQSGGGIGAILSEAHPTSEGWLGVLGWRFFGPSGEPMRAWHLVRILATTNPAILPVRRIHHGRVESYATPQPCLFANRDKLLLWEPGQLTEIGPEGQQLRQVMKLSGTAEPHALMGNRWLVRQEQGYDSGTGIDAVDLNLKVIRPLFNQPPSQDGRRSTSIRDADDTTLTLLLITASSVRDAEGPPSLSLLSVPNGERRAIRTPWAERVRHLWRGYLVAADEQGYSVYDSGTLKLVKHLRRPVAPPALPGPAPNRSR